MPYDIIHRFKVFNAANCHYGIEVFRIDYKLIMKQALVYKYDFEGEYTYEINDFMDEGGYASDRDSDIKNILVDIYISFDTILDYITSTPLQLEIGFNTKKGNYEIYLTMFSKEKGTETSGWIGEKGKYGIIDNNTDLIKLLKELRNKLMQEVRERLKEINLREPAEEELLDIDI